jgi:hypothetical protein
VLEAGVSGPGVDLLRERELPDSFEAQERGMGKDFFQGTAELNVPPDRDADESSVGLKKQVFGYHEISKVEPLKSFSKDTQQTSSGKP